MLGKLRAIFLRGGHGEAPQPFGQANAHLNHGLLGDFNGKRPSEHWRQVLLVHTGDLEHLGLQAGDLREQLTVDLPGLMELPSGARLEIGDVTFQITRDCEPCIRIGGMLGKADVDKFEQELNGYRGMFARVAEVRGAGRISSGDAINVTTAAPQA